MAATSEPVRGTLHVDKLSDADQIPSKLERAESAGSASGQTTVEGLTLDEWRERMKNLSAGTRESAAAVPGLIAIVRDREVPWFTRRQAALTLGRLGADGAAAVPVLIELLYEESPPEESTRLWGIKALALLGAEAKEATPRLVGNLRDDGLPLPERLAAAEALGRIGTAHAESIPALVGLIERRDAGTALRAGAAEALGSIGPDATAAVPALIRAARDRDELLRRTAATALGVLGASAEIAVPTLVELLVLDESAYVRDAAVAALSGIGPAAASALEHLLSDTDSEVRWRAAAGLQGMGRAARGSVPALAAALEDESPLVRMGAAEALWAVGGEAEVLVPVLLDELTSEDRQLRMRAVRLLDLMGKEARGAEVGLRRLLEDEREFVRRAAGEALERLAE